MSDVKVTVRPEWVEIDKIADRLWFFCRQPTEYPWKFTGWKWGPMDYVKQIPLPAVPGEPAGFVAQWCYYEGKDSPWGWYVNLPGFQSGRFTKGGSFDIGSERVTGDETQEQIVQLVTEGKHRLLKLLKENNVKIVDSRA